MFFGGKNSYFCKKFLMIAPYIDIHTHRASPITTDVTPYFSYGVHPWWLHREENVLLPNEGDTPHNPMQDLKILETLLQENRIAAIGETGIDRFHPDTLSLQLDVFEKHIQLSEQYQKPLIIHNVRATNEILRLHKQHQPIQKWIIHGFNGSEEEAQQLINRGIFLSVGESIWYQNRKISKTIKSIPLENLFLETDTSELTIQEIYQKASERLNLPLGMLKEKIFTNFARLKLTSWKTGETAHDCSSATRALINLGRATC